MGNNTFRAEHQVATIDNDLPPRSSLDEWKDQELLLRVQLLQSVGPCSEITKYMESMMKEKINDDNNHVTTSSHQQQQLQQHQRRRKTQVSRVYDEELGGMYWNICALSYLDSKYAKCMLQRVGNSLTSDTVREFYLNTRNNTRSTVSQKELYQVVSAADECISQELNDTFAQRMQSINSSSNDLVSEEYQMMTLNSETALEPSDVNKKDKVLKKLKATMSGPCRQYALPPSASSSVMTQDNTFNYNYLYSKFQQCTIANMCANEIRNCMMNAENGGGYAECFYSRGHGPMEQCVSNVRNTFEETMGA